MSDYKLVVVDPFENYRRGDQIFDQSIVEKILDQNHEMHAYDRHVRRALMSEIEKQIYIAPIPENKEPEPKAPMPTNMEVESSEERHIESIKSDSVDAI